jgi:hypothetical protein
MSDIKTTIVEYALQNEDNLEIAFETFKAFNEISDKISKDFLFQLKERLEKTFVTDNWIFPDINTASKLTFLMQNKTWPPETAFGLNDFNDIDRACFAVKTSVEDRSSLLLKIQVEIQGKITGFGWWTHLISPYNKWNETFDGLKSVYKADHLLDYTEVNIIRLSIIIDNYYNARTL